VERADQANWRALAAASWPATPPASSRRNRPLSAAGIYACSTANPHISATTSSPARSLATAVKYKSQLFVRALRLCLLLSSLGWRLLLLSDPVAGLAEPQRTGVLQLALAHLCPLPPFSGRRPVVGGSGAAPTPW